MYVSTGLLVSADLEVSFSMAVEINVPAKVLITRLRCEVGLGKDKGKVKRSYSTAGRKRKGSVIDAWWTYYPSLRQKGKQRQKHKHQTRLFAANSAVW